MGYDGRALLGRQCRPHRAADDLWSAGNVTGRAGAHHRRTRLAYGSHGARGRSRGPAALAGRTRSSPSGRRITAIACFFYRVDRAREPKFDADQARERWHSSAALVDAAAEGKRRVGWTAPILAPISLDRRVAALSLGFVTDTRPVPEMSEVLQGVDLLVCEGTYGDDADREKAVQKTHMTFREAATIADESSAGELWLTHFSPAVADPIRIPRKCDRGLPEYDDRLLPVWRRRSRSRIDQAPDSAWPRSCRYRSRPERRL